MKWWHISLLLCLHGFFKEYRPSEPFITSYLVTWKGFTKEQVHCHLLIIIIIICTLFKDSHLLSAFPSTCDLSAGVGIGTYC